MIRAAVFGAGQAGRMVSRWLPATHELICYMDNDIDKQGQMIEGVPVLAPEDALGLSPDRIWIATLNREAAASIEKQLRNSGYRGTLLSAHAFRDALDIRLAALRLIAPEIASRGMPGAVAELGVFRGEFAAELNRLFPDRDLYLFDTFEGFPESCLAKEEETTGRTPVWCPDFSDTSVEQVLAVLPHPEKAHFVKGVFPASAGQPAGDEKYAFVSLDADLYDPTIEGLEYFWPRMAAGGVLMVHDYNSSQFPGVRRAVREFADAAGVMVVPLPDLHGTAVIVKDGE